MSILEKYNKKIKETNAFKKIYLIFVKIIT